MEVFDAWVVAAALFIKNPGRLHYKTIAKKVLETGLTTLGKKGDTPPQTLGVQLRKASHHDEKVFRGSGNGFYELRDRDAAAEIPKVDRARRQLDQSEVKERAFLTELEELRKQNELLRSRLRGIAGICNQPLD